MEAETVFWLNYPFGVYDFNGPWRRDVGGIYIMTGLNLQANLWIAQYIGETDSYHSRIPSHGMWPLAVQRGATHVHAMVVEREATRLAIEKELIQAFHPLLNTQHRLNWADLLFPVLGQGR